MDVFLDKGGHSQQSFDLGSRKDESPWKINFALPNCGHYLQYCVRRG